jgi:4-diphosphocytidyl-2-C-methyl-D-erythritol kinase
MIKIQCPAKINLTLKVLGKRDDGFHNIESIMQTISLFDYITIFAEPWKTTEIVLSGTSDEIPYDERNLVYKAAELFIEHTKKTYSINIHIEKNIPVAAGLAGGSTDAAGTLYGLNELFGNPLSREEMHELCAKLGSDLNFCLEGGRQLASGRGEILTPLEFEEFFVSLIKPLDLSISAKEAYGKLKLPSPEFLSSQCSLTNSTLSQWERGGGEGLFLNDLEGAVIDDYPQLQKIKSLYPDAVMSGSGPAYFLMRGKFMPLEGFWLKNGPRAIPYGVKKAP